MGEDLYESFINYQSRIIHELDGLARDYGFHTLDATREVDDLGEELCARVAGLLTRKVAGPVA
jgi:hypothetical protein